MRNQMTGLLTLALALVAHGARSEECRKVTRLVAESGPLRLGQPAPAFAGWTPSSELFNSTRHREATPGQVLVVSFFATWCKPCAATLPVLARLSDQLKGRASIVLVAVGEDALTVGPWAAQHHLKGPIVLDPYQRITERFGNAKTLPRTFVIDPRGDLSAVFECEGEDFESVILQEVARAGGGRR